MPITEYERIVTMYEFLTDRYGYYSSYTFENFYKCFDPKHNGVKGNNLEILKKFENLKMREVFTVVKINNIQYGSQYLDAALVNIKPGKVCIHPEMGYIFLGLIVHNLKSTIETFIKELELLNKKFDPLIKLSKDGRVIKMSGHTYDEFEPNFRKIEDYGKLFRFIAETNSHIMYRNTDNVLEINISKMKEMIKNLSKIDFSKIDV